MKARAVRTAGALLILGFMLQGPGCAKSTNTNHTNGCPAGTILCGDDCIDPDTDHANCGRCGRECEAAEVCFDGDCSLECPAGREICNGTCVNLDSDPENCGICGHPCAPGAVCAEGACEVRLSGQTSGLKYYPGARVVIDGNLTVLPYNGDDDVTECDGMDTGCLRIEADEIVVIGGVTINASGAGYGGGGGGGGGTGVAGGGESCGGSCTSCSPGDGGMGDAGGENGDGGEIGSGSSIGGAGGAGGGEFGGSGGSSVTRAGGDGPENGNNGQRGGYAAAGENGDASEDESLRMGSGGGGGSGGACSFEPYYSSVGGSGGGGAGNPGGGYVKLIASVRITIDGTITTEGLDDATGSGENGTDGAYHSLPCDLEGSGGDGGEAGLEGGSSGGRGVEGYFRSDYNDCVDRDCSLYDSHGVEGGDGGSGGAGAGGGIMLKAPAVHVNGSLSALGGGNNAANGGTVKIFYVTTLPSEENILAGKILMLSY